MGDVLLTHSNHLFNDRKQVQKMQPYPPLQTLIAAAVLRDRGWAVSVCDVTFDAPEEMLARALQSDASRLVIVCEDDFNFLTKMCLARNRELAFRIAQTAKALGRHVAVHGSDSSDHPVEYLDAGFDCVLVGEVEETVCELAAGRSYDEIAGLVHRSDDGPVRYNPRRILRTNLATLPRPAWDLIDLEPYRQAWQSRHGLFSLNLVSSRGCPYRCNWCAKPVFGDSYRSRPAELVAEELLHVKRTYRPDHIWFADDIFALSARWTQEFAASVEQLHAQIPFKMQSRCDLMTRDTVAALRRAGCAEVWMGAESGSQRVLDAMDKGIRLEHIYEARNNLARYGIRVGWFLQFGYPGEGWEDIQATIRMVRETKPDDIGISVSYPLPGTRFHQIVAAQMGLRTHWSESGDLTMMFRGAYSTELYRALAEALHREIRQPEDGLGTRTAWARVEELKARAA